MSVLDTVSSVVGLTTTFMDIAGIGFGNEDKPRWDEVLSRIDESIKAIEGVAADVNTAIDMITRVGEDLHEGFRGVDEQFDELTDKLDTDFVNGILGAANGARNEMMFALAATSDADFKTHRDAALAQSNTAMETIALYGADGGLKIGAIASIVLTRVAIIETLGDGAFSGEFKSQMLTAADAMRSAVGAAVVDMEDQGGTFERWFPTPDEWWYEPSMDYVRFTSASGAYVDDYFNVASNGFGQVNAFTDEIMAAGAAGGIGAVRDWLASLTIDQIAAELGGTSDENQRYVSDRLYYLDQARSADMAAGSLDDLLQLADQWQWLASGSYLVGDETANVIDVTDPANPWDHTYRDVLDGKGGDDTLSGGKEDNAIRGGDGDDRIDGRDGSDVLRGAGGDDVVIGGAGGDTIDGGAGIDTADYADAAAGVTVDLNKITAQDTGQGKDTVTGIENLIGSGFDDQLTGNALANRLSGGAGNDSLSGGDGADTLSAGLGLDTLVGGAAVDLADYSSETRNLTLAMLGPQAGVVSFGGVAEDHLSEIENVTGGAGNDSITADNRVNLLVGGAGNDTLDGGQGSDKLFGDDRAATAVDGADSISGGSGDDTVYFVSAGRGGVDRISGGEGRDTFTLSYRTHNAADVITDFQAGFGGDFIDLSRFGAANASDAFASGLLRLAQVGADTILQYDIDRTLAFDYRDALVLEGVSARTLVANNFAPNGMFAQQGWDLVGTAGSDAILGTAFAEKIYGGAGDDILQGREGADSLDGGAGLDTADFSDQAVALRLTLKGATEVQVKVGTAFEDTLHDIENVYGGAKGDLLKGDALDNLIRGGGGADTLDGAGGVDIADYGDKKRAVVVTLNGGSDVVVGVDGHAEDVIRNFEGVYGGSRGDTLDGDGLDNVLAGGGGGDILTGGAGRDLFTFISILDSTAGAVGRDRIMDFHAGEDDRIDLHAIDADISTPDVDDAFHYVKRFSGDAGEVMVRPESAGHWLVRGDVDGDGLTDFSISVTSPDRLFAGDFVF
jgi:Ca2+-binding RTX toxin-like protein